MEILSTLFHKGRWPDHHHRYSAIPTSPNEPKRKAIDPKTMVPPMAPQPPMMRKKSTQSRQRTSASNRLRNAIAIVLKILQQRRHISEKVLKKLQNNLEFYEYYIALINTTSFVNATSPNDVEIVRLLHQAWTCQCLYLEVVIREADKDYWELQAKEAFVPVKEAEYRLRLERALAKSQGTRKELSDRLVSLALM